VDYNAEQIERGTGVDAEHLDLDAVRERVQAKLRERECWGDVRLRPAQDSRDATHDRSNAGAKDESAGSGSAAGRGATAAHPGGSRSQH
jgi:hypothetical protein